MNVAPDSTTVRVGRHIGEALRRQHMSNAELARRLGVDASTVGHYVKGRVNIGIKNLVEIAEQLGVTPEQLLTGDFDLVAVEPVVVVEQVV